MSNLSLRFRAAIAPTDIHTVTWQDGTAQAKAPGKVNLYFAVGEPEANGYHPVASLYAATNLLETVTLTAGSRPGIRQKMTVVKGSPVAQQVAAGTFDPAEVPLDDSNLAYRGAAAVMAAQGLKPEDLALELQIQKAVPVAGGMGGGSADAAAAMKATNRYLYASGLASRELTLTELMTLGAPLGADVPFALLGGIAVGEGIGDRLTSLSLPEDFQPIPLTLIPGEEGLSTPAVFKELDAGRSEGRYPAPNSLEVPERLVKLLTGDPISNQERLAEVAALIRNDLADPAVTLQPGLAGTLAGFEEDPHMVGSFVSGSGPTVVYISLM